VVESEPKLNIKRETLVNKSHARQNTVTIENFWFRDGNGNEAKTEELPYMI
jgi:hypothetical protein